MLRFVGDGDQKKFTKNPRHFSMQNSQANTKKIFTKFFRRAGKVTFFAGCIFPQGRGRQKKKKDTTGSLRLFCISCRVFLITLVSDFSSRPWRNLPPTWVIHMATPHTSPQHADPHGFLVWFSLKRPQVHVDRRVVGWCAGHHVDHPCGWQIFGGGFKGQHD